MPGHRLRIGNMPIGFKGVFHTPRDDSTKALEASIQAIKEAYEKKSKNLSSGYKNQAAIMRNQAALQDVKGDYGELVDKMIELGQDDTWLSYANTRNPEERFNLPGPGQTSNRQAIKEGFESTPLFNSLKAFAKTKLPNFTEDDAGEKVVDELDGHFKKFFEALGMIILKNDPTLLPESESMGGKKTRKHRKHRKHRKSKKARKSHKKRNKSHRKK
jgi:hypothetical protein